MSEKVPSFVAEKRTVRVIVPPGGRVVPSGSAVRATKPTFRAGGFDRTNDALRPPALCSVKVESAIAPNGTLPRSVCSGVKMTLGGGATFAVRVTVWLPPSECTVNASVYIDGIAPTAGANATFTNSDEPGEIVAPGAGTPDTV